MSDTPSASPEERARLATDAHELLRDLAAHRSQVQALAAEAEGRGEDFHAANLTGDALRLLEAEASLLETLQVLGPVAPDEPAA